MKKKLIIVLTLFLLVLGVFVYFVGKFTKVYDPLNSYQFDVGVVELKIGIIEACENIDGCKIVFSDVSKGERNYAVIRINRDDVSYAYNVILIKKINGSIIDLTTAYDYSNPLGSNNKKDVDIEKNMKNFENLFINTKPLVNYLK